MTKAAGFPVNDEGLVLILNGGGRPVLLSVKQAEAHFSKEKFRDPKGHPVSATVALDHPDYNALVAQAKGEPAA